MRPTEQEITPRVFVIILNYNGWRDTLECLESLKKATYPNYETVVVDNRSTDNSVHQIKSRFPSLPVVCTRENLGFAGGMNLGIRYALKKGADLLLLLNNDITVEPDFLDQLVLVALLDNKIAMVGPLVFDYYSRSLVFASARIDKKMKLSLAGHFPRDSSSHCWESDSISGCAMLMPRDSFSIYSLFLNESLFMYCEEIDLSLRAKQSGLKIMVAGRSRVYHKGGAGSAEALSPIKAYYGLRNRVLLAKEFLSRVDLVLFWLLFSAARFIRLLGWMGQGRWDLLRASYWALLDGVKGRAGETFREF